MRKLFIITSIAGTLLYGGIFAFWGHDWDLSDPMFFMLAFPTGKDFINLYAAGQVYAQSLDLDVIFNSDRYAVFLTDLFKIDVPQYHYVWSYPPSLLLPARLFAGLPYLPALGLWSIATLAIYLGGLRLAGLRGWWLVAALLPPAAAVNLFFGQYGFVLAGLLLGGLSQVGRRPMLAGLLLGLATIKPQLGLLLPVLLLAQRQWYVMAVAAVTALSLIGLSIALDGMAVWRQYFELILPVQRMFLETASGFFMLLTLTPFMAGKILGLPLAAL
ncbi:MAG: glycosyltransferase family 87 protein, partial [Alphaproteobacteria bacterium]|nr:glycosyltransferase family 87 protein [Alphaproteobacteria bacterium]